MSEPEKQPDEVRSESKVRWIMVGVVGGAMLLYFVVSVFRTPLQADTYTNSYSTSPGGHTALIELLRKSGREVTPGKAHLDLPNFDNARTDTLAMLEPGMQYVDHFGEEFAALFTAAREESTSMLIAFPSDHRYEHAARPTTAGTRIALPTHLIRSRRAGSGCSCSPMRPCRWP